MFTPIGPSRKLVYPLYNQVTNGNITEPPPFDEGVFVWPEDSTERVVFPMFLSLDEYNALASAIDVGADIAFPQQYIEVIYIWMRQAKYPVPTEICEQIIECVENDEDVQEAIVDMLGDNEEFAEFLSDYISEHPDGSGYGKNRPIPETTKITTVPACDLDILWAQCRGIVETSNQFIVDFIEKWEVYTNKGEVVSDMLNAVPFLAELVSASGMGGVLEYANDLVDSIGENYTADYDEVYEIQLACELFCKAQEHPECRLSIVDIMHIMQARVGGSLNISNVTELIVSLTDQDITGINVADLYLYFFFAAMQIGNIVLPVDYGYETFVNIITVINEPSDDWEGLCEECPVIPDACTNFTAGQGTYIPANDDASNAQFSSSGIGQENNTYLTVWGLEYDDIHAVTITFDAFAWDGSDDYHKFFVTVSNVDGSNLQTFGYFSLFSGAGPHTFTTAGANWTSLRIQVAAGGLTYPPNVNNPTPVYIIEICVDPVP